MNDRIKQALKFGAYGSTDPEALKTAKDQIDWKGVNLEDARKVAYFEHPSDPLNERERTILLKLLACQAVIESELEDEDE